MATTNFVSGTVIESTWLNDVDEAVYTTLPAKAPVANATFTDTTTIATLAATTGTVTTLGSTDLTATNLIATAGIDTVLLDTSGAAIFGSTASFAEIITASKGIAFPAVAVASADANTLDDYEEGTFTPSVLFGASFAAGGNASMGGTFSGKYTKIGRQVTCEINITLTAKGSSTGNAYIGGLPFTAGTSLSVSSFSSAVLTYTVRPSIRTIASTAGLALYYSASGGAYTALTEAAFANTTNLYITCTYTL